MLAGLRSRWMMMCFLHAQRPQWAGVRQQTAGAAAWQASCAGLRPQAAVAVLQDRCEQARARRVSRAAGLRVTPAPGQSPRRGAPARVQVAHALGQVQRDGHASAQGGLPGRVQVQRPEEVRQRAAWDELHIANKGQAARPPQQCSTRAGPRQRSGSCSRQNRDAGGPDGAGGTGAAGCAARQLQGSAAPASSQEAGRLAAPR